MTEANPLALVVDDEQQIRRFLRAGLELDGLTVEEAESGQGALQKSPPGDSATSHLAFRPLLSAFTKVARLASPAKCLPINFYATAICRVVGPSPSSVVRRMSRTSLVSL
jgi:FixJ family two-component response regulator